MNHSLWSLAFTVTEAARYEGPLELENQESLTLGSNQPLLHCNLSCSGFSFIYKEGSG